MTSNTPTSKRLPVMVIARLRAVGQRMQAKKKSVPLEGAPVIGSYGSNQSLRQCENSNAPTVPENI